MLRICPAYSDVRLTIFQDQQYQQNQAYTIASNFDQLRRYTEKYYHGFMLNWNTNSLKCILSDTERTCRRERPETWTRNGVRIYSVYAEHILIIGRSILLDALCIVSMNHGILHNLFVYLLVESILRILSHLYAMDIKDSMEYVHILDMQLKDGFAVVGSI